MMLLSSAVHLLSIYIALELSSYPLYVLMSLRRARQMAMEAALKFFLVGITASALMLLGLALLYGRPVRPPCTDSPAACRGRGQPLVQVGLMLTLCGSSSARRLSVPRRAPDIYQGAAHPATGLHRHRLESRCGGAVRPPGRRGAEASGAYLAHVLVSRSILSMTVGNLAAIAQKDLKRMFAYSSIAQAGYVLIGILSMSPDGYAAAIFYSLALLVMKFTCFLVLVAVAFDGANIEIAQLARPAPPVGRCSPSAS